jgi:hypothetical protein
MNKLLSIALALGLVAGIYFYATSGKTPAKPEEVALDGSTAATPAATGDSAKATAPISEGGAAPAAGQEAAADGEVLKSAADSYRSAEEALNALLKGAKEYDDSILEQFTQPGPDCTWCAELYSNVRAMVIDPATSPEQKSYLAEILAISGRTENVQALLDGISSASSKEEADLFAEALELTLGGEDVTALLGQSLASQNEQLRESSVAALTNQGTRQAAEILIKEVLQRGDPDGYYSRGVGPGEFIPNEEAIPPFQELVQRRDEYSHLGVKALINSGLGGLRLVFDELENTPNLDTARAMLKDAPAHVNYEDGLREVVDGVIQRNRNPVAVQFAQDVKKDLDAQAEEEAAAPVNEP